MVPLVPASASPEPQTDRSPRQRPAAGVDNEGMLQVCGLGKRFAERWAVRDLDLTVDAGETVVILGHNGAGKSTALRCMAGLMQPTLGTIRVAGHDVCGEADIVRGLVGLMPEQPGLYERMSALAYLEFFGQVYGVARAQLGRRIEDLLTYFELWDRRDDWLASYSKGMRQKLSLIRATVHRPSLILCDEPTSALDADSSRRAWAYLGQLRSAGSALVLCTHNPLEAERLADRVAIMSRGTVLALGTQAELALRVGVQARVEERVVPTMEDIYLRLVESDVALPALS